MTDEHTAEDAKTQVYELAYHVASVLSDGERETILSKVRELVSSHGGSFITEGTPEDTRLAYAMKDTENTTHHAGFFGWMKFEVAPSVAGMVLELVKAEKGIVRARLLKTVREDTRAATAERTHAMVQEVETKGVIEKKIVAEEPKGEVSEEALDEAIDELTGDDK